MSFAVSQITAENGFAMQAVSFGITRSGYLRHLRHLQTRVRHFQHVRLPQALPAKQHAVIVKGEIGTGVRVRN